MMGDVGFMPAMSFEEIAEKMGTTRGNVWDAYLKGMRKLRKDPTIFHELTRLVEFRRAVADKQIYL